MMAEQFYTILTDIGKASVANATALGEKVDFRYMALGDGDGGYYNPSETQTGLKKEVYRREINHIQVEKIKDVDGEEKPTNRIKLTILIPGSVGGFTVREAGILDTEGNLIAIGKYPETYKPRIEDGSSKDLTINMVIEVANTSVVTLKIDPTVILATKKDLDVLSNRVKKNEDDLDEHVAESMPHQFMDSEITYKWGFRTFNGQPQFIYKEV